MKLTAKMLFSIYAIVIVLTVLFLIYTEGIFTDTHNYQWGGRDIRFTFHDIAQILVVLLATGLAFISTKAYLKKDNERLFFVSIAFFLFAIKAILNYINDHLVGYFGYIDITILTIELVILVSLFFALLRK